MSEVNVNMFPCENRTEIEVRTTEASDYIARAINTCKKAEQYVNGLGPLSLTALANKKESKIFRDFIDSEMNDNYLVLSGVSTAAWVKAGMIAQSIAKKGVLLGIEFVE